MGSDCLSDRLADHQITVSISLSFPSFLCLGNAFVSLELSLEFLTFFSLFSFIHAWTFISLQIKEFQIMGLSINDSVYSCVFFFLTGLHFFHLLFGLFLLILFFWSCSFPFQICFCMSLRSSEVVLF